MFKTTATIAHHITIEPGDGTHYEFIVSAHPLMSGMLRIAGTPHFTMYDYWIDSILATYDDIVAADDQEAVSHHFISYVAERCHSDCNVFTARAMILAVGRHFGRRDEESTDA